jgi:vanillate O-demethylase monooxygenase subunit
VTVAAGPLGTARRPTGRTLTNVDPSLANGFHPVCLAAELTGQHEVRLLGRRWSLRRDNTGQVRADPEVAAVEEANGLVWLAPAGPVVSGVAPSAAFDDPSFPRIWLAPQAISAAAGLLADNFCDMAHFPFVHAATIGSVDDPEVPRYSISPCDEGFDYRYTHRYSNEEDPGVALGIRPREQTRRVTCSYRWPFQMQLRLDHVEAGGTTILLFSLQPRDRATTVAYTCLLRAGFAGGETDLASDAAYEQAILDEDIGLQEQFELDGLPIDPAVEVNVRPDAAGIHLRRTLARFAAGTGLSC